MIHPSEKNRSAFCHVITDFHSTRQCRVARFDILGVLVSIALVSCLMETVRLLLAK